MTKALMVASFAFVMSAIEPALACSVPRIRTLHNQTVDGHMTARSGRPCSIRMRTSSGPTSGASIAQRPANGSVTIGGGNRIIYRSRPGFVGGDAFAYARHGHDRYNSATIRTVRVTVTVTP